MEMSTEASTATMIEEVNNPGEPGGGWPKNSATELRPKIVASGTMTSMFRMLA
jgi:hypothetical protein